LYLGFLACLNLPHKQHLKVLLWFLFLNRSKLFKTSETTYCFFLHLEHLFSRIYDFYFFGYVFLTCGQHKKVTGVQDTVHYYKERLLLWTFLLQRMIFSCDFKRTKKHNNEHFYYKGCLLWSDSTVIFVFSTSCHTNFWFLIIYIKLHATRITQLSWLSN
jgi:hypothetical protein